MRAFVYCFFFLIITKKIPKQKKKFWIFLFSLSENSQTPFFSVHLQTKNLSHNLKKISISFSFSFFGWKKRKRKHHKFIGVRGFCVGPSYETFGFVMSAINTVPRSCALHALARVLLFSYFGCPFVSLRGQVHCCVT